MKNNDWKERLNVVYSTTPDYKYETSEEKEESIFPSAQQCLHVQLDRKNRGCKVMTLVADFVEIKDNLKELSKLLKSKCGWAVVQGWKIVQGDFKQKVLELLKKEGYTQTNPVG